MKTESEHTVRTYPAPRGQYASHCTCGEGSPLYLGSARAEDWARKHVAQYDGRIVEPRRVET